MSVKPNYVPNSVPVDENDMRMYVLINREKLTIVQAGVQAAHAIAEYATLHGQDDSFREWSTKHKTLIFLEASEFDMRAHKFYYEHHLDKKTADFIEPDMNDTLTAIAFEPIKSGEGKIIFGKYSLLR